MFKNVAVAILGLVLFQAQSNEITPSTILYKTVDNLELQLHIFFPEQHDRKHSVPAIVFFHGGGWVDGHPSQFFRQSTQFAKLGMVAISVEYRLKKKHGATPLQSVFDARSALRFIKSNATRFGLDATKIVVSGGSAGGHLALSTALIELNDVNDDTAISPLPHALILYNPIIDTSENGYGYNRVKSYWRDFSPIHNISGILPPTLILLGTEDNLVPVSTAQKFEENCKQAEVFCRLVLYENELHGFFNHSKYKETLEQSITFLTELELLPIEIQP